MTSREEPELHGSNCTVCLWHAAARERGWVGTTCSGGGLHICSVAERRCVGNGSSGHEDVTGRVDSRRSAEEEPTRLSAWCEAGIGEVKVF